MNRLPIEGIPQEGYCILSFRDALLFERYEYRDGKLCFPGSDRLERELPYDCRFFDREKDCHLVFRESRGDICKTVLTEEEEKAMDPDLVYAEEVLVREEFAGREGLPKKLLIVNRYRYTEYDTLTLKNYRISYQMD